MIKKEAELLKEYIDLKIAYELACNERDDEGYTISCPKQEKEMNNAWKNFMEILDE